MRAIVLIVACLALAGCLKTTKITFDETNSMSAADSPILAKFIEAWGRELPNEGSPEVLIQNGNRVKEIRGVVIVQEASGDGTAEYYAVGLMGDRPAVCFVHDEKMDEVAERHGVKLEIDRSSSGDGDRPASMKADGEKAALYAFVVDAYSEGMLSCQAMTKLVGGPS